jgi:adenine-specific DNA-methyltransferase
VTLFAIDGVDGYSAPLSEDFLKSNPSLVLDTRHFDALWSEELLAGFTSLDDQLSGMLVHGDNANALRLLKARLKGQIDCVYIDPPYNTGSDHFVYKDNYRHSTWLTMMEERLEALFPLAGEAAALFVSIDDNEAGRLVQLIQNLNEDAVFVTLIAAQLNPRGRSLDRFVAKNHEYITCVALRGGDAVGQVQKSAKQVDEYKLEDTNGRYRLLELRNRQSSKFNRLTRPNLFYSLYVDPKSGAVSLSEDSASFVEALPRNTRGEDGCWTWGQPKVRDEGHLLVGKVAKDGTGRVFRKDYLVKEGQQTTTKSKTIWTGKELNNELGKELLKNMFDHHNFSHPKSPALIEKCIELGHTGDGWFADFFAGSGSSGHAILNRLRAGHAVPQYLLVEWGEYFDAILQPRILKAIYSDQWKDGVPTHGRGVSQLLRCIELESYEDALENLEFTDASAAQKALLDADDDAREEYTLRYLLGKESAGSASLLNLGRFADPFNYTLKRVHDGDTREQAVDLVATFNTLLGLRVNRLSSRFFVDAEFSEERGRMRISGHLQACPPGTGWCFRVVDGHTPEGERTLIIWRTLSDDPERDNLVLEAVVGSRCPSDGVDQIYVNGDNSLAGGLQRAEVHLIEPAFEALMFADAARP